MPWQWVDPEVLCELAEGTVINHSYKGNNVLNYHFHFEDKDSSTGRTGFDIRDWPERGGSYIRSVQRYTFKHARDLLLLTGARAKRRKQSFKQFLHDLGTDLYEYEEE